VTEDEVLALFEACSNAGRWGDADEIGTLNLITPELSMAALRGVRSGTVVSLGFDIRPGASLQERPGASLAIRFSPRDALDTLTLDIHGFEITHLDAPGHVFFEGRAFGGRSREVITDSAGLGFGSIRALGARAVVTRGVLLDVAAARGVERLPAGEGIGAGDLEAAEAMAGVKVSEGDAIFVRSGHGSRAAAEGATHDEGAPHEGVLPDVLPWLHERGVAVYSGDCIERRPSGYPRIPMPLHQVGLVAMGLCLLDCPDVEALREACRAEGRAEFALVVAPLRVIGGTGSAVNPLAIF
jgi:kynurenine formamidase